MQSRLIQSVSRYSYSLKGCSILNVYGCEKPCPDNCHENRCEATNGTCEGCTPGWIGEYCQQGVIISHFDSTNLHIFIVV